MIETTSSQQFKTKPPNREFSDLLMEQQSAKEEGDLHELAFLDTPRGVHPLAQNYPSDYKRSRCHWVPVTNNIISLSHLSKIRGLCK